MEMPVLDKNDSWDDIKKKLEEEYTELQEAIKEKGKDDIAEEAYDVIQVAIGALEKLREEGLDIEKASQLHLGKLVGRGWKFRKILQIIKL